MIKSKTKTICLKCNSEIHKQKEQYFTCPVCGNQTWQSEIIEEFEEFTLWEKFKRWWGYGVTYS